MKHKRGISKPSANELFGISMDDNETTQSNNDYILISSDSEEESASQIRSPVKKAVKTEKTAVASQFEEEDFIAFPKMDDEKEKESNTKLRVKMSHDWGTPWFNYKRQVRCRSHVQMLNNEMHDLIQFLLPTKEEHCLRQWTINQIANCLSERFPGTEVQVYGSFNTKLYLPTSDLDLVVFVPEKNLTKDRTSYWLHQLSHHLKESKLAKNVEVVTGAKVPIAKFQVPKVEYHVDISINSDNGPEAAKVCIKYLKQHPGSQQLSLLVKHFLYQRNMNEVYTGGLGSYAVLLMVVSFLQHHRLVQSKSIDPLKNLGVLFFEFLDFYGNQFKNIHVAISTVDGGRYMPTPPPDSNRKKSSELTVWDPLDPKNNVTGGSYGYVRIKSSFAATFKALTLSLCLVKLNYDYSTQYGRPKRPIPILKNLVEITDKDISHRNMIQNLFYQMKLKTEDLLDENNAIGFD